MASPQRRRIALILIAAGAVMAVSVTVIRLQTIHCALRSELPTKDSTTWFLECDDGALLGVQLPEARDGHSELRVERGPDGLTLPSLVSALSLSVAGCRTTPFRFPALEVVEGPLRIGGCDLDRFREKARFLRRPPDEALE